MLPDIFDTIFAYAAIRWNSSIFLELGDVLSHMLHGRHQSICLRNIATTIFPLFAAVVSSKIFKPIVAL